jgi:hypothetical protein
MIDSNLRFIVCLVEVQSQGSVQYWWLYEMCILLEIQQIDMQFHTHPLLDGVVLQLVQKVVIKR